MEEFEKLRKKKESACRVKSQRGVRREQKNEKSRVLNDKMTKVVQTDRDKARGQKCQTREEERSTQITNKDGKGGSRCQRLRIYKSV